MGRRRPAPPAAFHRAGAAGARGARAGGALRARPRAPAGPRPRGRGAGARLAGDEAGSWKRWRRAGRPAAPRWRARRGPSLVRVINATGVVIHTNLGRAPLPPEAAARVAEVAASYTNLELDLATGERGEREVHAESRLRRMLGAEATVGRQQQRRRRAARRQHLRRGPRGPGEPRRAGGDRRLVPHPRRPAQGRGAAARGGDHQPHAPGRLPGGPGPGDRPDPEGPPQQLPDRGLHRVAGARGAGGLARAAGVPAGRGPGQRAAASRCLRPSGEPTGRREPGRPAWTWSPSAATSSSAGRRPGWPRAGAGRSTPCASNPLYRALRVDKMTRGRAGRGAGGARGGPRRGPCPCRGCWPRPPATVRARAEAMAAALRRRAAPARGAVVGGASAVGGGAAPAVEVPTALLAVTASPAARTAWPPRCARAGPRSWRAWPTAG